MSLLARERTAARASLRGRCLLLFVALAAASAAVRPVLAFAPPLSDEAAHLLGSFTVLDGGRLYVDFVDNKPPLLYWSFAAAQRVLGAGLGSVRLFAVLLVVPLTGLAASAFWSHDRRGAAAGFLYVLLSGTGLPEDALPVHSELLMLLPAAWSAALIADADDRALPGRRHALAGTLLGLAALCKPTAIFWLAAAPIALLLAGRGPRPALRAGVLTTAGFALPVVATALVFARMQALDALVERVLLAGVSYVASPISASEWAARAVRGGLPWLVATAGAWWAFARGRREPSGGRGRLVDALVLCSIPAVALGGRFYGHYFLQLLFPLCLGAAGGLSRFDRQARLAAGLLAATVLGFLAANAWLVLVRTDVVEDTFPLHRDVARRLRADPCYPGARLFVWGLAPRLYLEAGLPPASRFVLPQEGISGYRPGRREAEQARSTRDRALLIDDLERKPATYVLDLSPSGFHRWDRFPLTTFPALLDLLQRRYEVADTVDDVVIHRLRDCRAASARSSR